MNGVNDGASFLIKKPPYSKSSVNRQGKLWRDGFEYDTDTIDAFLEYNAEYLSALTAITKETVSSFIFPIASGGSQPVAPNTYTYNLTARVKTKDTLLEKLRRMGGTPLFNIHDVAGFRFDCDVTLKQQSGVADAFKLSFMNAGADRVDIKDFRDDPHSGYRAVHLHIRSQAGRAEMQIRTALQSKWANLYEEAADILGRDIRYLHEGATVPAGADTVVDALINLSKLVRRVEELSNSGGAESREEKDKLREDVYGMLDSIHHELHDMRVRER